MKLFKIFESWNSEKKLPTKEYLYQEFYRRTERPLWFHSKKFYNENHERLNKIEIDNIKNLINNYPKSIVQDIEKISDFTLDCIISETLYKVRSTKPNFGDIGIVYIKDDELQFYYSNTQFHNVGVYNSDKDLKNRIQIKKEILGLINKT